MGRKPPALPIIYLRFSSPQYITHYAVYGHRMYCTSNGYRWHYLRNCREGWNRQLEELTPDQVPEHNELINLINQDIADGKK